ncbi:MAG: M1 family metallopeptidase [Bacteroidetes bacterium]|nr:M1 family metallopeptidase [Bacteroidota bacterium]MBU1115468.1 M1 family metallopeptidase [Bacteroidota bacterium]MBU1800087.1 M1 family metallopeptidase [Bacteroidota bacterium]
MLISIPLFIIFSIILLKVVINKEDSDLFLRNLSSIIKYSFIDNVELPNRNIDVLEYELKLDIFQNEEIIKENAKIKLVTNDKSQKIIELDLYDNFKINFVKIEKTEVDYNYSDNKIEIDRSNILTDTLNLEIDFEGEPQNLGFGSFWMKEKNNKKFVATLNEPIYASTWFPCNDTPADKALLTISITNDSNIVSLSNGKLKKTFSEGNRRTYIWNSKYPISTYLISIYSGEYKNFSQKYFSTTDTMDIDYYVTEMNLQDAKKDFAKHPEYLKVLSELFGEYPFIKDKYGIAEILWQKGAMESQTITGIGSNFISGMNFYESMLIHELAHHWWGNSVTPKTWKDIWLNEGFATYSEALYYEKISGFDALKSTMSSFKSRINSDDIQKLYNPGTNLFSSTVYNKGAWVLHMLRKEIGDFLFFVGLKAYYNDFQYKNAEIRDFKKVFEKTSKRNLDKFFNQWIFEGSGFLELEIKLSEKVISKSEIELKIDIKQIQTGYENYHFPLDIELEDSSGNIKNISSYIKGNTTLKYKLKNRLKNAYFDKNNWLLAFIETEIYR